MKYLKYFNIPIVLGWLAMIMSFVAALGFADTETAHYILIGDSVNALAGFSGILSDEFGADGFLFNYAGYFPDVLLSLPLLWLGLEPHIALAAYAFLWAALMATGWMLVCERLGGGAIIQSLSLFAVALQFLVLAYPGGEFVVLPMLVLHHGGVWAIIPWMLLSVINAHSYLGKITLFALLVACELSDLIIAPWFVAPCIVALIISTYKRIIHKTYATECCVVMIAATIIGYLARNINWLFTLQGVNTNKTSIPNMINHLKNDWSLLNVYPIFATIIIIYFILMAYMSIRILMERKKNRKNKKARKKSYSYSSLDIQSSIILTVLILTGIMAASYLGKFKLLTYLVEKDSPLQYIITSFRYAMPFYNLPLFVGWCLMPIFYKALLKNKVNIPILIIDKISRPPPLYIPIGIAAIIITFSIYPIIELKNKNLNPFNSPYMKCINANAKQYNWTGVIGVYNWWNLPLLDKSNSIKQLLPIEIAAYDKETNAPLVVVNWNTVNRHMFHGEFQVVALDNYNGNDFSVMPRNIYDQCSGKCNFTEKHPFHRIDESIAKIAFGKPDKILECEGVGLYYYDPPIKLNFKNYTKQTDYPKLIMNKKIVNP